MQGRRTLRLAKSPFTHCRILPMKLPRATPSPPLTKAKRTLRMKQRCHARRKAPKRELSFTCRARNAPIACKTRHKTLLCRILAIDFLQLLGSTAAGQLHDGAGHFEVHGLDDVALSHPDFLTADLIAVGQIGALAGDDEGQVAVSSSEVITAAKFQSVSFVTPE